MKKVLLFLMALLPLFVSSQVKRTIHVATAGTLPTLISEEEKYQIEELTLSGELNGTDFKFIRDMAGVIAIERTDYSSGEKDCWAEYIPTEGLLKSLNLAESRIVSGGKVYYYEGDKKPTGSVLTEKYYTESDAISSYLFARTKLETIILPNSITFIGSCVFYNCNHLKTITIPKNVTGISNRAFANSLALTSIVVESGNQNYDSRNNCNAIVDNNNQLIAGCKNTIIPNSVTSIGAYAFEGCCGLTSINIPDNMTSIGDYAFYGCSGLNSIDIPDDVTSIGDMVFSDCSSLTSITIPNNVTSIGDGAFQNCSSLIYVTLPNNLTSIGSYAFYRCTNLTDVYCSAENVPSAEATAFYELHNISLHVPYASRDAYKTTIPWNVFKSYLVLSSTDTQESTKCSKPKISIVDGKVTFDCETSYVTYHWSISSPSGTNGNSYNMSMGLLPITIYVYATKDGYQNSEVATYKFSGLVGDVDGDGLVNVADHVKLSEIIMNQ